MGSKCCGRESAGRWPSWCEERGALQQEGGAHSQPGERDPFTTSREKPIHSQRGPFTTRREGCIHHQERGAHSQPGGRGTSSGGRGPFITRRERPIHNQEGKSILSRELKDNGLSKWAGRLWRLTTRMSWDNNQRSILCRPQNTSTAALSHCSMVAKRRWHKSF